MDFLSVHAYGNGILSGLWILSRLAGGSPESWAGSGRILLWIYPAHTRGENPRFETFLFAVSIYICIYVATDVQSCRLSGVCGLLSIGIMGMQGIGGRWMDKCDGDRGWTDGLTGEILTVYIAIAKEDAMATYNTLMLIWDRGNLGIFHPFLFLFCFFFLSLSVCLAGAQS